MTLQDWQSHYVYVNELRGLRHTYIETRSFNEDAFDSDGKFEVCKTYVHDSIDINGKIQQYLMSEIAYCCWLLGIGFGRVNGLFDLVSADKFVRYDRGDTWAVWAGLATLDVSHVLSKLEQYCERLKDQPY